MANQHLYITSDEEIREGDWFIDSISKNVLKATVNFGYDPTDFAKKIIATTDESLRVLDPTHPNVLPEWNLPKPTQAFIQKYVEEYNKNNIITDVIIEYTPNGQLGWGYREKENRKYLPKINPKNNTITIKRLKDSWSKDEVIKLCKNAYENGFYNGQLKDSPIKDPTLWIEENIG